MYNTVTYQSLIADIHTPSRTIRIPYTICSPPPQLPSRGTVILLHDFFKSSYQFRHCIDLFAMAGYISIALDFPGRTLSPSSRSSHTHISMRTLVAELSQYLDTIRIHAPTHIIGAGFGAHLAAEFAVQHSEMIASITCLCEAHPAGDARRLEKLLRLPASSSGKQLRVALQQFFEHAAVESCLSEDDVEVYIEPFAQPARLLDVQQATKQILRNQHPLLESLEDLASLRVRCMLIQPPTKGIFIKEKHLEVQRIGETNYLESKNLSCDPEGEPENFVVAVLRFLRGGVDKASTVL